jgi:gliding motility-associated-like protein
MKFIINRKTCTLLVLSIVLISSTSKAQCTTTITSLGGSYIVNYGQDVCIAAGAYTGSITVQPGGTLRVCGAVNITGSFAMFGTLIQSPSYILTASSYFSPGSTISNPTPCGAPACGDTSLAPSIPKTCSSGGSIDLNNYNGTSAAGTWSITTSPIGSTASISSGHTFNINNSIGGNYKVRHTLTTVGPGCPAYAERTITIYTKPNISVANAAICAESPAHTFDAGAGYTSYTWSANGTGTSQTTSGSAAGTYTVRVTDANGCKDTASATLTVNSKPNVILTNATICGGDPAATFDAGAGYTSYTWSVNGTGTSQTTSGTAAGTYTVQVVDANGCKDTSSATLTVNSKPNVILSNATICAGDPAAIFDAGAGYTLYTWSVNGTGTSQTTSGTVAGTYTVQVVDANGCKDTSSATLIVNSLPIVTLNLDAKRVCIDHVPFTVLGGAPSGGVFSMNGNVITMFDASLAGKGKHVIKYTITNSFGCVDFAIDTMTVDELPTPTISPISALCKDATPVQLNGSPIGGTWKVDNNSISNPAYFDPSLYSDGSHTIQYNYSDTHGCKASATTSVTINALPTPVISAPSELCSNGNSIQLTASPAPGSWKIDNINSSDIFDPKKMTAGSHSIEYSYSDANSCKGVDTKSIMVNLKTTPVITSIADVCINATGVISLIGTPSSGIWLLDGSINSGSLTLGSLISGNHEVRYIYTDSKNCIDTTITTFEVLDTTQVNIEDAQFCEGTSYTYTLPNKWSTYTWNNVLGSNSYSASAAGNTIVSVTDANGCTTQDMAILTEIPYPTPAFPKDTIEICLGESAVLNPNTASNLNYLWSTSNATTPTITVYTSGLVKVDVSDNVGCKNSDSVYIKVNTLPSISLGKDTSMCANGFDKIVLNATYFGKMNLSWSTNEKNTNSITIAMTGEYWVQATDENSCVNSDTVVVAPQCPDFKLKWPNVFTPNGDGYNDYFTAMEITDTNFQQLLAYIKTINISIYDRWGIKVFEAHDVLPMWDGTYNGDIAAAGTYYFVVKYTNIKNNTYEDKGHITLLR